MRLILALLYLSIRQLITKVTVENNLIDSLTCQVEEFKIIN